MTRSQGKQPSDPKVRFHPSHKKKGPLPPLHAERLYELIGVEKELNEAARILRHYVQSEKPPVVGAMHVTCSDEAERECVEAFQRNFVRYLLPSLKFFSKAAFRTSNLGSRYEWGAARIAEDHFADAKGADQWKLLVIKLNSHVSVDPSPEGPCYGRMTRYEATESVYCGAIDAVLSQADAPFADELEAAFAFEGVDRLGALRDPKRVDPALKNLYGAVVGARVQARRAMLDVQDYAAKSPTLYMILPCVTLNRVGHDTEILCGIYTADCRESERHYEYCGLGDRPERYELASDAGGLRLTDPDIHTPRNARDHRSLVVEEWRRQGGAIAKDDRLHRAVRDAVADKKHHHAAHSRLALKALLAVMAQVAPVPAAMLLFGQGLVHIHHAQKAHQLAREAAGDPVAREMLDDIAQRVDTLDHEQAKHLVELLLNEYGS